MTVQCGEFEFYSRFAESCVHCEPFCRLYPEQCAKTSECQAYRVDYQIRHQVPTWAIGLIIIIILALFALGLTIVLKYCPCDFLCKVGCMFSFKKKRKSKGESPLPYQTKDTWSPDPVVGFDVDAIRRRTIMDRFWASIEQHPPHLDEMEPLSSANEEVIQKTTGSDSISDISNGSDLQTAMAMMPQGNTAYRPSLDNRKIIEHYHLDRVTRQGSFRLHNAVNNTSNQPFPIRSVSKPEVHRPVQTGRRTGLKNLLNRPARTIRAGGASETTV